MKKIIEHTNLSDLDKDKIDKLYPIKLTPYLISQAQKHESIKKQFFASFSEFDTDVDTLEPFKGLLHVDMDAFERLYEDRIVLKLNSVCPAHCRFCYRRAYVFGKNKNIKEDDKNKALDLIKSQKGIRTILLTGGSPLLIGIKKIKSLLEEIVLLEQISQVYFALGRPIMDPSLITIEFAEMISTLNRLHKNVNIACTVHINHYDELTEEVVDALNLLTSRGITVWTQSTLLKGINDDEIILSKMYQEFRRINLIPYYLIHAMPLIGASHFRTSIEKGIKIMKYLEQFSGHERPIYIVLPSVGKVQITGNTVLKYKEIDGKRYAILNTPYKTNKFFEVENLKELPANHYTDKNGYVVGLYLDGID